MNVLQTTPDAQGYVLDRSREVSICGDWLTTPSLPGAWLSGFKLANAIVQAKSSVVPAAVYQATRSDAVIADFSGIVAPEVPADVAGSAAEGSGGRRRRKGARVQGSWATKNSDKAGGSTNPSETASANKPSKGKQKRGEKRQEDEPVKQHSKDKAPEEDNQLCVPAADTSERERLQLDAQAMAGTETHMQAVVLLEEGDGVERGGWKWAVRKRVWDLMELRNLAAQPRPVHHRIPNFVGAAEAAAMLSSTTVFQQARLVKVCNVPSFSVAACHCCFIVASLFLLRCCC